MKKKTLPKTKQFVDAPIKIKSVDRENRTITGIVASDGLIDRHGESLNPNGWKINGHVPILWSHEYRDLPIGKSTQERMENGQLILDVRFSKKYDVAGTIFDLITEDIIDKVSVGFIPLKLDDSGDFTWSEMELLETSFVNIPANPRAGIKQKEFDNKVKDIEEQLKSLLEASKAENDEELEAEEDTSTHEGEEKAENEAKEKADSPQEPEEKPEVEKTVTDEDVSDPPEDEPEKEDKTITLSKDELQEMLKEAAKEGAKEAKEEPKDNNEPEEKTLMEQVVKLRDALRGQYTGTAKTLEQINNYLKQEK